MVIAQRFTICIKFFVINHKNAPFIVAMNIIKAIYTIINKNNLKKSVYANFKCIYLSALNMHTCLHVYIPWMNEQCAYYLYITTYNNVQAWCTEITLTQNVDENRLCSNSITRDPVQTNQPLFYVILFKSTLLPAVPFFYRIH